jgi:hypothetical protein
LTEFDSLFADIEASLALNEAPDNPPGLTRGRGALAALPVPADPLAMPEEFARSTMLALRAQQEILALELDEEDPHYKAKLMAKASVASQQITAQLKSDETALKSRIAAVSYYDEIKAALDQVRLRQRGAA